MSSVELEKQRRFLIELAKRLDKNVAELERETTELQQKEGDHGEGTSDDQEITNQAVEEYIAKNLLNNQEFTLSEIEAALERIKDGSYGKCVECKSMINVERMKALPYARRCIQCAKSFHG